MALPASGRMRQGADVNVELGNSATTQIALGQASVRTLYGVASGAIRLAGDGYGKSGGFSATISTNQQELNLRTWALANGWNGTSAATITVGSNVYIWSDNIATPGLTINGSWPAGITLVNSGFIMGKGGNGGGYAGTGGGGGQTSPQAGGNAISLGVNVSITNNSYIGGGGGGGREGRYSGAASGGGGGAGGGTGGNGDNDVGFDAGTGGAGGTVGNSGANGTSGYVEYGGAYGNYYYYSGGGGGGGRILPGTGGAGGTTGTIGNNNGKGGSAGGGGGGAQSGNNGGAGGSAGNAGTNVTGNTIAAGGGGWGSSGGSASGPGFNLSGGVGGKAIALNGFTATRTGSGSTYGAVS